MKATRSINLEEKEWLELKEEASSKKTSISKLISEKIKKIKKEENKGNIISCLFNKQQTINNSLLNNRIELANEINKKIKKIKKQEEELLQIRDELGDEGVEFVKRFEKGKTKIHLDLIKNTFPDDKGYFDMIRTIRETYGVIKTSDILKYKELSELLSELKQK